MTVSGTAGLSPPVAVGRGRSQKHSSRTLLQRLSGRTRDWDALHIDAQGNLIDAETGPAGRPKQVCLVLPPGLCLLRRFAVTGLSAKEIESALALWAETSLPEPVEQYYLCSWPIDDQTHGLAALPRAPLASARDTLKRTGTRIAALRVPELRPPADPRSGIVLWPTPAGLLACLWQGRTLYDWQSFAPSTADRARLEQIAACAREAPVFVYRMPLGSQPEKPWPALQRRWPETQVSDAWTWEPVETGQRFLEGPVFTGFLHEDRNQPVGRSEKLRLALVSAGAFAAALFLFLADVLYLERRVEQLRQQVSVLKVHASRSERVAALSGEALRELRELRAMTVDRDGVMSVLKLLSEALPPRVRLQSLSLQRAGTLTLDAVAETELDISRFLERMGQSALFRGSSLSFVQKEDKPKGEQALVRFRLETRLAQPLLRLPGETDGPSPRAASAAAPAAERG